MNAITVRFGNYLLSKERDQRTSKINKNNVTHADIENFKFNEENNG